MEYSLEDAKKDRNRGRSLAYAVISDFAEREHGTRYKLAEFLRYFCFNETSEKYEFSYNFVFMKYSVYTCIAETKFHSTLDIFYNLL